MKVEVHAREVGIPFDLPCLFPANPEWAGASGQRDNECDETIDRPDKGYSSNEVPAEGGSCGQRGMKRIDKVGYIPASSAWVGCGPAVKTFAGVRVKSEMELFVLVWF